MAQRPSRRRYLLSVGAAALWPGRAALRSNVGRSYGTGESVSESIDEATVCPDDGGGWPMYQYDAANTGHNPDGTAARTTVAEGWRVDTGDTVEFGPTVAGGAAHFGDTDGTIYAVDAEDGTVRWRKRPGGEYDGVLASPAVVGGAVYVPLSRGTVHALAATDGTELWRTDLDEQISCSPAVVDGTVYLSTDLRVAVYAIDAADGTIQWSHSIGRSTFSALAIGEGAVYVGYLTAGDEPGTVAGGGLVSIDTSDSTERWAVETDGGVGPAPAVDGETVYVPETTDESGSLRALDTRNGDQQWVTDVGSTPSSPALAEGLVYLKGDRGERPPTLYALDVTDGSVRWQFETDGWQTYNAQGGSPSIVDGVVCIGGDDEIVGLDTVDGDQLWRYELPDNDVESSPVVAGGSVLAGTDGGVVALQEDPDGTSLEEYTNENNIVDTERLRDAIDDWRAGDISTDLLRDVIDAWRRGDEAV